MYMGVYKVYELGEGIFFLINFRYRLYFWLRVGCVDEMEYGVFVGSWGNFRRLLIVL